MKFDLKKINKKGFAVTPGKIKAIIITLILVVVLLNMLPPLMFTAQSSVSELAENMTDDVYGDAGEVAENVDTWTGYFWIVGVIVLLMTVILGIFIGNRRRRY